DPRHGDASGLTVGSVGKHVDDYLVDPSQIVVVDLPVVHVAARGDRRLLGVHLVVHPQGGERHVDVRVGQSQVVGDAHHRGCDVSGAGPGGEQDLSDPQGKIERLVDLADFVLHANIVLAESRPVNVESSTTTGLVTLV